MTKRFNDDYYAVRINEWEKERIPNVVSFGHFEWVFLISSAVLTLIWLAGFSNWKQWLAMGWLGYVTLKLFVFLHEINENVRFLRHKLEAARIAHERMADQFRRYQKPDSVTVFDYVDTLDREWSD